MDVQPNRKSISLNLRVFFVNVIFIGCIKLHHVSACIYVTLLNSIILFYIIISILIIASYVNNYIQITVCLLMIKHLAPLLS